jgi:hypothetical protein
LAIGQQLPFLGTANLILYWSIILACHSPSDYRSIIAAPSAWLPYPVSLSSL